jgi:hypothetical protein
MFLPFQPLQLLLAIFAGWVNRRRLDVIAYLQEENRVLEERLGGRRIRFTDAERCRLKLLARIWRPEIGARILDEIRYSELAKIANSYRWTKQTHNKSSTPSRFRRPSR